MKVIMVAVVSANGKLTRSIGSGQARGNESDIYQWTSKEDQNFFFNLIQKSKLIVMGSSTYKAVRKRIRHSPDRLRIVLTGSPENYKDQQREGVLEFTSETPRQLTNRLINYQKMLLVGGSKIYTPFLKAGLVDEIYLTIEPVMFGEGRNLLAEDPFELNLELVSVRRLNKKGTLLLKYKVIK